MQLIHPKIEVYAENYTIEESETIKALVQQSDNELDHIDMLSGRVIGQLLGMLVRISGAERILELGTFTGCSSLYMAEALPEHGQLITCEYNERYEAIARAAFEQSEHGHKITMMMGPALQTIENINQSFDFIFLDADKINYPLYYKAVLPKLKPRGLLVIDNVLWGGEVLDPQDEKAEAIHKLNKIITDDGGVEQVMLTIRDGLTLVRKR